MMNIIGLTGGIASGKSEVAAQFASLGVPIIDADDIAKTITNHDQAVCESIRQHFGDTIFKGGILNRLLLRQIIFKDPVERKWLEQLLHPLIEKEIERRVIALQKKAHPYCVVVIPLLVEVGVYHFIDRVLVVDAPESLQMRRLMQRDASSLADAEAVLAAQAGRFERLNIADDVIQNDGSLENLNQQVLQLHHNYIK